MAEPQLPDGYEPISGQPQANAPEVPEGFEPLKVEAEKPGIVQRIANRFMGTDVDDPVELPRLGATVAGGFAGSFLGSRTPVVPGPAGVVLNPVTGAVAGGLVGSLTGAVAPEATMAGAAAVGLIDEETRARYSLSFEDMRTLTEGEALLELATGGGFAALRLVGRGTARLLTAPGAAGEEIAERAARQGIELMPVQVGGREIGRGYVAVMGRFPMIGGAIRKRASAAEEALRRGIEGAPERIGPISAWSEVSESIMRDGRDLVKRTGEYFDQKYSALWARADEAGVQVVPRTTLDKADEIIAKIARETPTHLTGPGASPGSAIQKVKNFIESEVLPMRAADAQGRPIAKQSLRQMDGLVGKIDQEIASLEPGQKRFAMELLTQLRQSAQRDSVENIRGVEAAEIGRAMRELDTEFSVTMSQVFETATAKQFGSVRRRGLRGIAADEATRIPADQLARMVVKLDSPQAVDELSRLVTPETFKSITAHVMDDAVSASLSTATGAGRTFDIEKFARHLGLDKPTSNRKAAVEKMLQASGSPLSVRDLEDLVLAGRSIAGAEIPNVSSFIARRAMIGGAGSIVGAFAIGSAVSGSVFSIGALISGSMFLGGGRLVSSILSNPNSARALKTVLDKEASDIVRREAYLRAIRFGWEAMGRDGQQPTGQGQTFFNQQLKTLMDALDGEEKARKE